MDLVTFFSQANNLEGNFVQVGLTTPSDVKSILDGMNDGTLTKRDNILFDSFEGKHKGKLGKTMDLRFILTKPNKKVSIIRGLVENTLPYSYNGGKIACISINLGGYLPVLHTLTTLHSKLIRDGLILVHKYGIKQEVTRAVDEFISQNNLSHQVFTSNGKSYIRNKVAPVEFKPTKVSKSDRIEDSSMRVEKTKPVKPFEDRYTKEEVPEFNATPVVKEGLKVIEKKVSR